ncbi:hypothetical protein CDD81_1984 [Ophiocordyceps australis]|uniref:MYG1 protein n=1 Tax=Ophiocordyceps australis TaxID=1399860 RepID=A0A2C5XB39_9HYPO|nr:hypothetical protein CDD81_1984 [Ophiocordyceps australis]
MAESVAKRLKVSAQTAGPVIGTHNGYFHADEALAVYMLRMLPTYQHSPIVRTRDAAVLATCHTVVDVGGEYDAERNRYDHHQRGFDVKFGGRQATKLSSAGLVFVHFGRAIVAQRMGEGVEQDAPQVGLVHDKLYQAFIEPLDAHDNGVAVYDTQALAAAGVTKRFSDAGFSLAAMVSRLNGNWNDVRPDDAAESQRQEDACFMAASKRMGEEFERDLDYYVSAWLPARAIVEQAYAQRHSVDARGRVLVFDAGAAAPPWKDHLFTLEEEQGAEAEPILYVLSPENANPGSKWRIQCVPVAKDSFESRKPLPEAWRGLRDEELDAVAGIPGGVFVHNAGFVGGNKTFDGVKQMALKALAL